MLPGQLGVVVVAGLVVIGLELWRRVLRDRTPRWIHVVTIVSLIEIVVGVVVGEHRLSQTFAQVENANPSDKATHLANGISDAMSAIAIAFVGFIIAVIVLVIGTALRRDDPTPPAHARR